MKTNILVLLLFSVLVQSCTFSALSANWKTAPTQEELLQRVTALEKQLAQQKRSSVFNNVTGAFKFTVDKIDKIVSKKAFIAAMLIAVPTYYAFGRLFGFSIIDRLLVLLSQTAVEGGASIATPISEGILRGALNVLWKNKLAILTISSITIPVIVGGTAAVAAGSVLGIEAAKKIGLELGKTLAPKIVPVIAGII